MNSVPMSVNSHFIHKCCKYRHLKAAWFIVVVVTRETKRWLQKQGLATKLREFAEPAVWEPVSG